MQTRSILRWCTRHDLPQLSHCPVVGTAVYLRTGLVCKLLPSSLEFLTSFSEDHFGFSPDGIERNFISVFKDHFVLLCLCVCCWGSGKWVVCLFFFYLFFKTLLTLNGQNYGYSFSCSFPSSNYVCGGRGDWRAAVAVYDNTFPANWSVVFCGISVVSVHKQQPARLHTCHYVCLFIYYLYFGRVSPTLNMINYLRHTPRTK